MISEDPCYNETLQKVIIRSSSALHGPDCPSSSLVFQVNRIFWTRHAVSCRLLRFISSESPFLVQSYSPRTVCQLRVCDQKILELIAKELSTKASSLLLKHSYEILVHIFFQTTATKALHFVIKVLTDATSSDIDIFLYSWD